MWPSSPVTRPPSTPSWPRCRHPGSPEFHHYLGAGQFASTFGPTSATIAAARAWLARRPGSAPGPTSPDGSAHPGDRDRPPRWSGPSTCRWSSARLADGRVARFAPEQPAVPASLASRGDRGGRASSTVATPQPQLVPADRRDPATTGGNGSGPAPAVVPAARSGVVRRRRPTPVGITANQLAAAYGFASLYGAGSDGAGVTIGIYELEPYTPSDIATYESCYGITTPVSDVQRRRGRRHHRPARGGGARHRGRHRAGPRIHRQGVHRSPDRAQQRRSHRHLRWPWWPTPRSRSSPPAGACASHRWPCRANQQAVESSLFAAGRGPGPDGRGGVGGLGVDRLLSRPSRRPRSPVDDPADQPDVTGVGGTSLTVGRLAPRPRRCGTTSTGPGGGGVSSDFAQPSWQTGPGGRRPVRP